MFKLGVIVVSVTFVLSLQAAEMLFAIDKSGFLVDSNRFALATFSKATLTVGEMNGEFKLPCRFSFVPGIGKDRCNEIIFSSTSIEASKRGSNQPEYENLDASEHSPMPKLLQIKSLVFDVNEHPFDVDMVVKQGVGGVDSRDMVLYQRVPENYFRYLCSSEAGGNYWWTRMLGKRVEYRIWPICCPGDEFVVEDNNISSKHFGKMTLVYARCGADFRLKNIVLSGDYAYKGGMLKVDPATLEMRSDFAESKAAFCENHESGIIERGSGVLRSQIKVKYTVYEQNVSEHFKVVIEICETI